MWMVLEETLMMKLSGKDDASTLKGQYNEDGWLIWMLDRLNGKVTDWITSPRNQPQPIKIT